MDYDNANIGERYDKARPLPSETVGLWMRAIAESIGSGSVDSIVDVGCGTGRFTLSLADWFNAKVIGIDPSRSMLREVVGKASNQSIRFCEGTAERMPIPDKSADLVFLSMVYHHIEDRYDAIREFNRVLRNRGLVCIRNSTTDLIDTIPYIQYFPSAREHLLRHLPDRDGLIRTMEHGGLTLLKHEIVEQQFALSPSAYLRKIRMRGLSDLIAISDSDFRAGLVHMEESLIGREGPFKESIDLLVFEKRPNGDGVRRSSPTLI
jgi:ubiquinone/menaquinone biosynthesis C-methylase UbiE